jgi:hypothetical protein
VTHGLGWVGLGWVGSGNVNPWVWVGRVGQNFLEKKFLIFKIISYFKQKFQKFSCISRCSRDKIIAVVV